MMQQHKIPVSEETYSTLMFEFRIHCCIAKRFYKYEIGV
jgi:hypothetical protein